MEIHDWIALGIVIVVYGWVAWDARKFHKKARELEAKVERLEQVLAARRLSR